MFGVLFGPSFQAFVLFGVLFGERCSGEQFCSGERLFGKTLNVCSGSVNGVHDQPWLSQVELWGSGV